MTIHKAPLFLAGFSLVSAALFFSELRTFSQINQWPATSSSVAQLSLRASRQLLLACDRAMSMPWAILQPNADLKGRAKSCSKIAKTAIGRMPTNGLAHLVMARSSAELGDLPSRNSSLINSARFAPNEGWLAERRFSLLLVQKTPLSPGLSPLLRADIATLLNTQSGAELLAAYYLRRPELRDILAAGATRSNQANQTRFLNRLHIRQAQK